MLPGSPYRVLPVDKRVLEPVQKRQLLDWLVQASPGWRLGLVSWTYWPSATIVLSSFLESACTSLTHLEKSPTLWSACQASSRTSWQAFIWRALESVLESGASRQDHRAEFLPACHEVEQAQVLSAAQRRVRGAVVLFLGKFFGLSETWHMMGC